MTKSQFGVVVVLILLSGLLGNLAARAQDSQGPRRYEVHCEPLGAFTYKEKANALGRQGWEPFSVVHNVGKTPIELAGADLFTMCFRR